MREDGSRLSFSITKDSFSITDAITGNSIILKKGTIISNTLDKKEVIDQIKNLQEALLTYKNRFAFKMDSIGTEADSVVIRTNAHFDWTISTPRGTAHLYNNFCKHDRDFDKTAVLRQLNRVHAALLTAGVRLNPKRDIVRRVVDIGAIVWKYEGHSILGYEQYVASDYITNCLVDGIFHDIVFVGVSKENEDVVLFDKECNVLFKTPLDESILLFHGESSSIFKLKEDEEDEHDTTGTSLV